VPLVLEPDIHFFDLIHNEGLNFFDRLIEEQQFLVGQDRPANRQLL
jgi:hypothetical protein